MAMLICVPLRVGGQDAGGRGQSRYRYLGSAAMCEIFGYIVGSPLASVPVSRAGCRRRMTLDWRHEPGVGASGAHAC